MIVTLGDDQKTGVLSDDIDFAAIGSQSGDCLRLRAVGNRHEQFCFQRQIHDLSGREGGISESAKRVVLIGKDGLLAGRHHRQRAGSVSPLIVLARRGDLSHSEKIEQRRELVVWVPGCLEKLFFNADRLAQIQRIGSVHLGDAVEQVAIYIERQAGNDVVVKSVR